MRQAALIAEFRARFEESVALHLRSDVPVGTCLSGGLDSSSIVCTVSAELHRRGIWREDWQHTFSACFDDPRLDERPYIAAVAEATSCQTHFVFRAWRMAAARSARLALASRRTRRGLACTASIAWLDWRESRV